MNIAQANQIRAQIGLPPLETTPENRDQKRRQQSNKAARAAESQRIKQLRASKGK